MPPEVPVATLDAARLPDAMLTNPRRYFDRLNFATNFALFREADGLSTRLVTANYWAGYGATGVRLWLRLFDIVLVPAVLTVAAIGLGLARNRRRAQARA